ncbi:Uncharacterised protein [Legionella sainthelensi]|nr:Uncharacterised protein [Legionella sainthelensi]
MITSENYRIIRVTLLMIIGIKFFFVDITANCSFFQKAQMIDTSL